MRDEVFIIGGGPSLGGFHFHELADKDTIAVNVAALDVPNPTYSITADSKIFRDVCEGRFAEVDTTWVLVTNPDHASMKYRNGKFIRAGSNYVYNLFAVDMLIKNAGVEGIGYTFKDFRTGYNSGFCAFQLAVLLGYHRIYLLGFDLQNDKISHYHNRYKGKRIPIQTLDLFYENFVRAFESLNKFTDVEVYSCSRSSKLNKHIPFIPFEAVQAGETPSVRKQKKEVEALIHQMGKSKKKPKLSILICSITERRHKLCDLLSFLSDQKTDDVEILVEVDNKKITTGEKRNILLRRAKGDYVCFIDDDDTVDESYVKRILVALKKTPDCVGFNGMIYFQRRRKKCKFIHSKKYKKYFKNGSVYYRYPNHLNPVKRELALRTMFKNITTGEDTDYATRLRPLLESEVFIERPIMYHYMTG